MQFVSEAEYVESESKISGKRLLAHCLWRVDLAPAVGLDTEKLSAHEREQMGSASLWSDSCNTSAWITERPVPYLVAEICDEHGLQETD